LNLIPKCVFGPKHGLGWCRNVWVEEQRQLLYVTVIMIRW